MLDRPLTRVLAVLGGFGLLIFLLGAFSVTPENRGTVMWIALGGLGLALLAGLAIGLVWAVVGGDHGA